MTILRPAVSIVEKGALTFLVADRKLAPGAEESLHLPGFGVEPEARPGALKANRLGAVLRAGHRRVLLQDHLERIGKLLNIRIRTKNKTINVFNSSWYLLLAAMSSSSLSWFFSSSNSPKLQCMRHQHEFQT